jgi:hypothetical protein
VAIGSTQARTTKTSGLRLGSAAQNNSGAHLGGEFFHETPSEKDGASDTNLNFGGFYNFSETYHLLFSAGHTVQSPGVFQSYLAFQITFGPNNEQ